MTSNPKSIIVPLPIEVRLLKPSEIWERHVRSRRVVYFDTSIWISLADGKTEDANECLSLCRESVRRKRVIFPLSYASIGELLRQPQEAPKAVQAEIMEQLSEGVTFRSAERILEEEARAAFRFLSAGVDLPFDRSELFTYVVEYLDDSFLKFRAGLTLDKINTMVEIVRSSEELRSLSGFLSQPDLMSDDSIYERFVVSMTESIKRKEEALRYQGRFNVASILDVERSSLLTSTVIPAFRNLLLQDQSEPAAAYSNLESFLDDITQRLGKGGRRLKAKLFGMLPATELFAQLMTARGLNPDRVVRKQDFWDIEHAKTSAAYADAFCTLDRGLIDLLVNRTQIPRDRQCRVLKSLAEISDYLCEQGDTICEGA